MKIKRFEDLNVWQEARSLAKNIYKIASIKPFSGDFGLRDQIRRASASIMLNIAEGFDSGSDQYFIQFLSYSRRSCSEVQSILYLGLDNSYLNENDFKQLYEQTELTRKLIVSFIKYLKTTRDSQTRDSGHLDKKEVKQWVV
jgi:four helix bundle protein